MLSVVHTLLWINIRRPLSEVAFVCGCFWTINALHAAVSARRGGRIAWTAALVALLIAATCCVRPIGGTIAAGCSVALLLAARRGRLPWPRAAWLGLLLLTVASVSVTVLMVPREHWTAKTMGERTYLDNFAVAATSFQASYLHGLQLTIRDVGRVAIPGMFKNYDREGKWLNVNMAIYLSFFALLTWGWVRWVRQEADPLAWTLPFYLALCTAYAMESEGRFLVPMAPALFVCLWFALDRLGDRRFPILAMMIVLHLGITVGYWLAVDLPRARELDRQWPSIDRLAAEIQTDPGPILIDNTLFNQGFLLQLALDRPAAENPAKREIRRGAAWIVMPAGQPVFPGFVVRCTVGPNQLLHRSAPVDHEGYSQHARPRGTRPLAPGWQGVAFGAMVPAGAGPARHAAQQLQADYVRRQLLLFPRRKDGPTSARSVRRRGVAWESPPLLPAWLAVGMRVLSERDNVLKWWLLPFALTLVLSLDALLRRFAGGLQRPLLAMIVLGPLVLTSFALMLDIPALALSLAAVALFLSAVERTSLSRALLAGAVAGLAMQTKYTGVTACGAILVCGILTRQVKLTWAALGLAASLFIAWEAAVQWRYGSSQFLQAWAWKGPELPPPSSKGMMLLSLVTVAGCMAPGVIPLGLVASRSRPRILVAAIVAIVAIYAALVLVPNSWMDSLSEHLGVNRFGLHYLTVDWLGVALGA